jgi:DNA-binding transcriptional MerR regulator
MAEMTNTHSHMPLRIGELATALGNNPKTIRYYEEIGLRPAPARSPAGYRQYRAAVGERLRFIAKAKDIGFTLREIREILARRDGGMEPCPYVGELLDHQLMAVETQLRLLAEMRSEHLALKAEAAVTSCLELGLLGDDDFRQEPSRTLLMHRELDGSQQSIRRPGVHPSLPTIRLTDLSTR